MISKTESSLLVWDSRLHARVDDALASYAGVKRILHSLQRVQSIADGLIRIGTILRQKPDIPLIISSQTMVHLLAEYWKDYRGKIIVTGAATAQLLHDYAAHLDVVDASATVQQSIGIAAVLAWLRQHPEASGEWYYPAAEMIAMAFYEKDIPSYCRIVHIPCYRVLPVLDMSDKLLQNWPSLHAVMLASSGAVVALAGLQKQYDLSFKHLHGLCLSPAIAQKANERLHGFLALHAPVANDVVKHDSFNDYQRFLAYWAKSD